MPKSIFVLIVMNIIWAGSYVMVKLALESVPFLTLIMWRMGIAALVLIIWIFVRRIEIRIPKKDLWRIVSVGGLLAVSHLLWVAGLQYARAADAALLYSFEPIWAIVLASLILKEKFMPGMAVGLLLAFIGLVQLSHLSLASGWGNVLVVAGLLCESLFSIMVYPLALRLHPCLIIALVLSVMLMVLAVPTFMIDGFVLPGRAAIIPILYLSIPCTAVGYVAWVFFMKSLPVNVMLFTIFIQPMIGPLIAAVAIGEVLEGRMFAASVFLIAGMIIAVKSHIKFTQTAV